MQAKSWNEHSWWAQVIKSCNGQGNLLEMTYKAKSLLVIILTFLVDV